MAKGAEFERKMCKILSLWWSLNRHDDIFWRTSQSGGRATERAKKNLRTAGSYGDLMAIHKDGYLFEQYFLIEFKKGFNKDLGILLLIDSKQKSPLLYQWWKKNENTRKKALKRWGLLIFQRDRRFPCIVMNREIFGMIECFVGKYQKTNLIHVHFILDNTDLVIIPLYSFLDWCDSLSMKGFLSSLGDF